MRFDTSVRNKRDAGGSSAEMGISGTKSVNFRILMSRFGALVVRLAQRYKDWCFGIVDDLLRPAAQLETFWRTSWVLEDLVMLFA